MAVSLEALQVGVMCVTPLLTVLTLSVPMQNPHEVPKVPVCTALTLFGVLLALVQCVRSVHCCVL